MMTVGMMIMVMAVMMWEDDSMMDPDDTINADDDDDDEDLVISTTSSQYYVNSLKHSPWSLGGGFPERELHVNNPTGIPEPSHSRGAPEGPQPLTLGDQYLTRYNTWEKFIRATRQVHVCTSPKTNKRNTIFILTGGYILEELNWSETFGPKRATPTVG